MRGKAAAAVIMIIVIFLSVFLSGCWNRREPEFMAIVLTVAFDYDDERDLYYVIAQIANPLAMDPAGGGASGEQRAFWTVSAYGHTPYQATRNLTEGSSRELFWGHTRIILFSENMARRGLKEVFDMIERERQFRLIARPAVVEGDIRKLMEAEFPLEETGASGLDRQMITIQFEQSVFHTQFLSELYSTLEIPGFEMFMGKIEVQTDEEGEGEENEGNGEGEEDGGNGDGGVESVGTMPPAKLGGGALFKEDRMVGWATVHQVEGWLYAQGRGHRFQVFFECPVHEGSYISVEIFDVSARMYSAGSGRNVRIKLEISARGRLRSFHLHHDLDHDSDFTRSMRRRSAQAVRNRIKDMIDLSQELETDVLGFGNLIYRKDPKLWDEIGDDWDEIYPELEVDIEVEFNLARTGLVTDPHIRED